MLETLRQMWDAGVPADVIAAHLGIRRQRLHELRREHGIPDRACKFRKRIVDPTPDEIRDRKRECRRRHFAEKRRDASA
jgi:hypothetical protein